MLDGVRLPSPDVLEHSRPEDQNGPVMAVAGDFGWAADCGSSNYGMKLAMTSVPHEKAMKLCLNADAS